jgi:uncharacterized protein (DUF58 family)
MIPADVLQKIRRIHITTARLASNVFAGEYKSVFKGRGLEFDAVREYQTGDEIRLIDWNVTARADKPYVKEYIEERELTIMILLDASRSNYFGSVGELKKEVAAQICSVLAASASKNNDRVGLVIFTDRIEKFIPPRKGRHHILRIIREALYHDPAGKGTDIPLALQYLDKVTAKSAVTFLVSDFYASGLKKPLSIANKRHDIIAVKIEDPRDFEMPDVGIVALNDSETGKRYFIDTSKGPVRQQYNMNAEKKRKELRELLNFVKIDTININTAEPYTEALIRFFDKRKYRRRATVR